MNHSGSAHVCLATYQPRQNLKVPLAGFHAALLSYSEKIGLSLLSSLIPFLVTYKQKKTLWSLK